MFYQIREVLTPCGEEDIRNADAQYVAVLSVDEWKEKNESFSMQMDLDLEMADHRETKAIVNFDSLTGSFSIPDRDDVSGIRHSFYFALDEKGIVLIDNTGYAEELVRQLQLAKKWKHPGLERFLYDLLEKIIEKDLNYLENLEHRLNYAEERIIDEKIIDYPLWLNDIRGDLLDMRVHYEQLIDLGQELEENENGFFQPENLRFFRLFTERVIRLQEFTTSLREYVVQLRDLIQAQMDVRQNRIMTLLTVVATIFMPLTLITGWYGMNFIYMPELDDRLAYPVLILVCIAIVAVSLIWFRRKKWL
ncbi:MAG: magnesium transporter CorA [Lachnospiraceae bacterium]|nr:magnesium transporter CorA [Lachnospiraceae bacterium]